MTRRDLQFWGVETGAVASPPEPPAQVLGSPTPAALESLQWALIGSHTGNQLSALIIDFTHEEILAAYNQLEFQQQQHLRKIWVTKLESGSQLQR
ncbi:hypothetical protein [Lyngbya sp. CCY1209]|uniref:hypothetical protein n=1 Tax=Lyngbya sp. CCY1209 TaxID=2886103 RepID=UPI002D20D849|nr:hypothetical protein [Lyngbya sp. CCY1209]MEB3882388.1 hypothetical protein [Lyngbya sp. CCY1209]